MSENRIKVSASTSSKAVRVNVSAPTSQGAVTLSQDTSAYNANLAQQWAVSENIVLGQDYSSKYYANQAKESASSAEAFESTIRDVYNGFLGETTEAIENVQGARDEAIANIETSRADAVDSINSTKTTILSDIEFVADGEKQEINELADVIKDNANTVNVAIEAGVERLNSIDALKKSQITNCITEIPQRIKYTLENGTLTIKAGSVVIVPYGTEDLTAQYPKGATFLHENFKVYDTQFADGKFFVWAELQIDISKSSTDDKEDLMPQFYFDSTLNELVFTAHYVSNYASGETPPTNFKVYYNTLTNTLKSTTLSERTYSFPIMLTTGAFTSIKQVFNGMGYIGSTIWVDKGVKGLIPNGRNEDGSLKNIEKISDKLFMHPCGIDGQNWLFMTDLMGYRYRNANINTHYEQTEKPTPTGNYATWYNTAENKIYFYNLGAWEEPKVLIVGKYSTDSSSITSFQPKQPFRAVDYSEFKSDLTLIVPTGTVISSANSTTPSGYLYCNGSAVSRTTYANLFSAIGTTYGTGDGSTTFNLPNYSNYNFVTSATVSVLGNGKALGLTTDGGNAGLATASDARLIPYSTAYNKNVGVSSGSTLIAKNQTTIGVIKNASTSGLTGSVTTAKINWYIKY